jgi:hypothetical protein
VSEPAIALEALETFDESQLLDRVERLRQQRNSGRRIYELTNAVEWEALLIWDETIEQYERFYRVQTFHQTLQLLTLLAAPR